MGGAGAVVAFEEDAELVAAQPERRGAFDLGHGVAERARHRNQRLIAGVVAEPVVDFLHAVDVEDEQRDRTARDAGPFQRGVEPLIERATVGEAGQRVLERQPLEPSEVLRVPERGRNVQRSSLQELRVVGAEWCVAGRGGSPQLAPDLAVDHDRHAELGIATCVTEPLGDRGILVRVVRAREIGLAFEQQRLYGRKRVEWILLVRREAHLACREHANVHEHPERLALHVRPRDRHRRGAERRPRLLRRHLEGVSEVVGGRHGARQATRERPGPVREARPGRVGWPARASRSLSIGGVGGCLSGPPGPFHGRPALLTGRLAPIFAAKSGSYFPLSP